MKNVRLPVVGMLAAVVLLLAPAGNAQARAVACGVDMTLFKPFNSAPEWIVSLDPLVLLEDRDLSTGTVTFYDVRGVGGYHPDTGIQDGRLLVDGGQWSSMRVDASRHVTLRAITGDDRGRVIQVQVQRVVNGRVTGKWFDAVKPSISGAVRGSTDCNLSPPVER